MIGAFYFSVKEPVKSYFWHNKEPTAEVKCAIISKINGTYGWGTAKCSEYHGALCSKGTVHL